MSISVKALAPVAVAIVLAIIPAPAGLAQHSCVKFIVLWLDSIGEPESSGTCPSSCGCRRGGSMEDPVDSQDRRAEHDDHQGREDE